MKTGEITCQSILGRSEIGGMDYAVNPYLGCSHACCYCYARFMTRLGHVGEAWGSFVDAKVNAVEKLRGEAAKKPHGRVLLSSVTDPYQPCERQYKLTRGCLEILQDNGFNVDILTKSDLVLRDLDIISKFNEIEIGLTLTAMDDRVRLAFEPGASTVNERLDALKKISDQGIPTYAFIGPLLPYLSEEKLEDLFDSLADRVNRVIVDRLNIKCGNMPAIRHVLQKNYPEIQPLFEAALNSKSEYYPALKKRVAQICLERAIPADILF